MPNFMEIHNNGEESFQKYETMAGFALHHFEIDESVQLIMYYYFFPHLKLLGFGQDSL